MWQTPLCPRAFGQTSLLKWKWSYLKAAFSHQSVFIVLGFGLIHSVTCIWSSFLFPDKGSWKKWVFSSPVSNRWHPIDVGNIESVSLLTDFNLFGLLLPWIAAFSVSGSKNLSNLRNWSLILVADLLGANTSFRVFTSSVITDSVRWRQSWMQESSRLWLMSSFHSCWALIQILIGQTIAEALGALFSVPQSGDFSDTMDTEGNISVFVSQAVWRCC